MKLKESDTITNLENTIIMLRTKLNESIRNLFIVKNIENFNKLKETIIKVHSELEHISYKNIKNTLESKFIVSPVTGLIKYLVENCIQCNIYNPKEGKPVKLLNKHITLKKTF